MACCVILVRLSIPINQTPAGQGRNSKSEGSSVHAKGTPLPALSSWEEERGDFQGTITPSGRSRTRSASSRHPEKFSPTDGNRDQAGWDGRARLPRAWNRRALRRLFRLELNRSAFPFQPNAGSPRRNSKNEGSPMHAKETPLPAFSSWEEERGDF